MERMKELQLAVADLDAQWVRLPVEFFTAAEEAAEARYRADKAKQKLDEKDAELSIEARETLDKVTEGAVAVFIANHHEHHAKVDAHAKAREELAKADALVEALRIKAKALENLSRLYVANYFTDSQVRGDDAPGAGARRADRAADTSKRVRGGLRRGED